tara:strand:+ start:286 stop:474 length:189 start_codon:yes stop_codon:yes gene_type:complete
MPEEMTPHWRKRVSVARSVKGVYTTDATVECTDTAVSNDEVVAEIKTLVALLENEWPLVIKE